MSRQDILFNSSQCSFVDDEEFITGYQSRQDLKSELDYLGCEKYGQKEKSFRAKLCLD